MTKLYREDVLDHAKNPHNRGKLASPTLEARAANPLCGDIVDLDISLLGDPPRVKEAKFESSGCVISAAASSMLMEKIRGKTKEELQDLGDDEILAWFGGELTSLRRECALLSLRALRKVLYISRCGL